MDHTIALIEKSHNGDKEAREQLVEENIGLIWCVVKRFYGRGIEAEDLFQIGSIGLIKAIDKFDLSYDVKFSTYAVPMISGEIKRFLRDDGMIKVSRSLKELSYRIFQTREKMTDGLGREPTLEELSQEMRGRNQTPRSEAPSAPWYALLPEFRTECIYCTTFGAVFKSGDGAPPGTSVHSWCVSRMESVWLQAIMDAATAVQSMAPKGVMRRLMRAMPALAVSSRPVA